MNAPAARRDDVGRASSRRARLGWLAIVLALVLLGGAGAVIAQSTQTATRERFDPESAGPEGTRALTRILAEHGVSIEVVRDRDAAIRAVGSAGPATLVLPDSPLISDALLTQLTDAATDVVIADPAARSVRLLLDARIAGFGTADAVTPACALPEAERAGPIVVGMTFTAPGTAIGCYPVDDGYGLLAADRGAGRVVAVDGTELFTNTHLAENGNAALAIGLMGRQRTLIWYVPTIGDSEAGGATLGELTPRWVSPAIVLLIVVVIAAALWRGRRFGPLVAETLPVTVRASETTAGRGRLYANARDPQHAARALQAAASARLAARLGLAASATPEAVADAVATRTGRPRDEVSDVLAGAVHSDRELVALFSRLTDLETAVHAATRPGKDHP